MRKLSIALTLLASGAALSAPARADTTWQGVSVPVINNDGDSDNYGETERYVVTFTFNQNAPIVFNNYPTVPQAGYDIEYYNWAYYPNLTSFSIAGPRFNVTVGADNAFTRVSTLRYERRQGGVTGFSAHAGSDGFSAGYTFDFNYYLENGFASTAIPATLNISDAFENGFVLIDNIPIEGTEEFETREVLNFRFASGGFLPAAVTTVPEPASWALMIAGFGLIGGAARRQKAKVAAA